MLTYGGGGGGGGSGLLSYSISYFTSKIVPNLLHNKQALGGGGWGLAQEKEVTILRNQVRATLLIFSAALVYITQLLLLIELNMSTEYVIRNTAAYGSIRQHTAAYGSIRDVCCIERSCYY